MKKNILILFGLLDLLTIIFSHKTLLNLIKNPDLILALINLLTLVLLLSILLSGILSILKKKSALIIYYFQFPFKLGFFILSFGFILKIFDITLGTSLYYIVSGIIIFLEFARLLINIIIHKKYFKKI